MTILMIFIFLFAKQTWFSIYCHHIYKCNNNYEKKNPLGNSRRVFVCDRACYVKQHNFWIRKIKEQK